MQELTNDNYSDIKLYSIFRIEYKAIEFNTNKKEPTIACLIPAISRGCLAIDPVMENS